MITFIFSIVTVIIGAILIDISPGQTNLILGIALFIDIYTYLFIRSYFIVGEKEKVSPLYCGKKALLLIVILAGMGVGSLAILSLFMGNYEGLVWTVVIGVGMLLPIGAIALVTGLIFGEIHRKSPGSPSIP